MICCSSHSTAMNLVKWADSLERCIFRRHDQDCRRPGLPPPSDLLPRSAQALGGRYDWQGPSESPRGHRRGRAAACIFPFLAAVHRAGAAGFATAKGAQMGRVNDYRLQVQLVLLLQSCQQQTMDLAPYSAMLPRCFATTPELLGNVLLSTTAIRYCRPVQAFGFIPTQNREVLEAGQGDLGPAIPDGKCPGRSPIHHEQPAILPRAIPVELLGKLAFFVPFQPTLETRH